jgi:hypothetical protein
LGSARALAVAVYHAPIDAAGFESEWERIGNESPTADEISGFAQYLKMLDFERYAEITHQDVDGIIAEANTAYKKRTSAVNKKTIRKRSNIIRGPSICFRFFSRRSTTGRSPTWISETMNGRSTALKCRSTSIPTGFPRFFRGESV